MLRSTRRLAFAATLSLALASGCAAPLATTPGTAAVAPPAAAPGSAGVTPAPAAPSAPQALTWTTLEGDANYLGQPLAHATLRVVDALTDAPAHVVEPVWPTYRLPGQSAAIGVETETTTTDAQGHFRVKVAGLVPGQAVRLVVQAGDNALSTLVLGGQTQPAGYRVNNLATMTISIASTAASVAATGVLKATTVLKPTSAEPVRQAFVQQVGAITGSSAIGTISSSLAQGLVSQTDPKTGGAKESEAAARASESQADLAKEKQRQLEELMKQMLKALQELQEAKNKAMRDLTRVYRVSQADGPPASITLTQLRESFTKAFQDIPPLPGVTPPGPDGLFAPILEFIPAERYDLPIRPEEREKMAALLGDQADETLALLEVDAQREFQRQQDQLAPAIRQLEATLADALQGAPRFQTTAIEQLFQAAGANKELVAANQAALVATVTAAQDPDKRAGTGADAAIVSGVPLPGTGVTADLNGPVLKLNDGHGHLASVDVTQPDEVAKITGAGAGSLAAVFTAPKSSGGHGGASAVSNTYEVTPLSANALGDASLKVVFGSQPDAIVPGPGGCWVLMSAAKRVVRVADDGTAEAFDFTSTPRAIAIGEPGAVYVATDAAYERLVPESTTRTTWPRGESGAVTMLGYVGSRFDLGLATSYQLFVSSDGSHLRYFRLYDGATAPVSATTAVLSPGVTQIKGFSSSFDFLEILTNAVPGAVPVYRLNETPLDMDGDERPDDELTNQAFGLASPSGVPAFDAATGLDGGMVGLSKAGQSLVRIDGGVLTTQSLAPNQPVALDAFLDTVWIAERGNGGQLRRIDGVGAQSVFGLGGLVPVTLRMGAQSLWVLGDRELKRIVTVELN